MNEVNLIGFEMSKDEIKNCLKSDLIESFKSYDLDIKIKDVVFYNYEKERKKANNPLKVLIEYEGDIREDGLFNLIAEENLTINNIKLDINPIRKEESGSIKEYLKNIYLQNKEYKSKNTSIKQKTGTIDNYTIISDGEKGGLSTSKIATSKLTNEKAYVKIVSKKEMKVIKNSLKSEMKILNKLKDIHGITKAIEFFEDKENLYLVEKYIEGKTLSQIVKEKTLSKEEKQNIFKQLLFIVKELHKNKIVHRDLKPNNILIEDNLKVHIIDFNISKRAYKKEEIILGNINFSAPEQMTFGNIVSPKNDVYSLGKIYEHLFEKISVLSLNATEKDVKERSTLGKLISDFDKELLLEQKNKQEKRVSLKDLITEATTKTDYFTRDNKIHNKDKKQQLEI